MEDKRILSELTRPLPVAALILMLTGFVAPAANHEPIAIGWIVAALWAASVVVRRGGGTVAAAVVGLSAAWVVAGLGLLTEALRALITGRPLAWRPTVPYATLLSTVAFGSSLVYVLLLRRRLAAQGRMGGDPHAAI